MPQLSQSQFDTIAGSSQRELNLTRGRLPEDARLGETERRNEQPMYLGKFVADVAKGASERFEIWSRGDAIKGVENPTADYLESVFCRTANMTSNDLGYAFYVDGGYEANKAEC